MTPIKRVLAIHDMSGFGRCSLTVALPVLSAMGMQCCPLPSAYLSANTAFDGFTFADLTNEMLPALLHWKKLGIGFDAIYSGFLGSEEQMSIVRKAKELFPGSLLLVDPVMGDNGKPYRTYTRAMCEKMAELVMSADIVTPNLTEASILLDCPYSDSPSDGAGIDSWLRRLSLDGRRSVVITGVSLQPGKIGAGWLESGSGESGITQLPFVGQQYSGTGDLFASVFLGCLLNGMSFSEAVNAAGDFVGRCIRLSWEEKTPAREGVRFETLLHAVPGSTPYLDL